MTKNDGVAYTVEATSAEKREYLALLQEPIGRMSTASSVFKGFSATIVTGIIALSATESCEKTLYLTIIPLLAFAIMDIYYLRLEKMYRRLYIDVLVGEHPIDFSIELPKTSTFRKKAKASLGNCLLSPSILLFYPAVILVFFLSFLLT